MMHTNLISKVFSLALVFASCQQAVQAATVSTDQILANYTVRLSEKEAVLMNPNDSTVQKAAMWDHPYQRIADRNMPWIEVTNAGESTAQITQFLMTIGDTDFNFSDDHFGNPIFASANNPAGIDLDGDIQSSGNQLVIDFTGFDPGETVRFRVDIDPDDPDAFPHPDFRRVLFDMNGSTVTDNAQIQLRYSHGTSTFDTPPRFLEDYAVNPLAGIFVSFEQASIRPYTWMEPVEVFEVSDRAVIPEPSTSSIAALVLLVGGYWSRRKRANR